MYRLGLASPTECWTGTLEYIELISIAQSASERTSPTTLASPSEAEVSTPASASGPATTPVAVPSTPLPATPTIVVGSIVERKGKPETAGAVLSIEGDSSVVKWSDTEAPMKVALSEIAMKTQPSEPARPGGDLAGSTPPPASASASKSTEKKKTSLEAAKFGQRLQLGVVLWLDITENGLVNGIMEICEFRARIRVEGSYIKDDGLLRLEETRLEAGKNCEWQCRFGQDTFRAGTVYLLHLQSNEEEMACEFTLPADGNGEQSPTYAGPVGSLKLQRKRLFRLSADAHGTSMIVPKERNSVRLSALGGESNLAGLALADVGFSRGVHYWEIKVEYADDHGTIFCGVVERPQVPVYPMGVPVPNLNKWEKVPVSWGFISFRAALYMTANSATGGTEQIYGEFYETGDTVGVLLDMDVGEISFFIDALKFGEHIRRDLGPAFVTHQLGSRAPLKWNPTGEVQMLYPAIGLKRCAGDSVSLSAKYISFPSSDADDELENLGRLRRLLRGHFRGFDSDEFDLPRKKLPDWFIDQAYLHYQRWSENRYKMVPSRAGGRMVELDTSPEAMAAACALGGVEPPFFAGERVGTLQSEGRELSATEHAIILGARLNRIWYSLVTVSDHEGFTDGATWAFYWEPEELALLMREDENASTSQDKKQRMVLSKEEFKDQACDCTYEADFELVRLVNLILQRDGEQDFMNLNFDRDFSAVRAGSKSEHAIRARVAILRLFNCMVQRGLPLLSSQPQAEDETSLTSCIHKSRRFVFTSTKRAFWDAVLKATVTGTTLSSEEYVDPPQIRTVCVNRIKATPAKLAAIPSESKRMKRSVFGQLYAEMLKWPDHSFRRAYCGKGHGGQKRAFKLKLIGEGVDDYGGPYRQAFEVVCDELQNDTEWPDQRRACLLPLLIPCSNRYSGVGDVGRDKFVLNPSAKSPSLLRRFEFLGKLIGTAVRHGLQLGLDFPALIWRKLVGLNVTRRHLEEIDVAFVRDLKTMESVTLENFSEIVGTERKFQVVLSDGTLIGDSEEAITFENVHQYVTFALETRLKECDIQLAALKRGLRAVLPCEHFSLFTAEELETLVCGRRELDVELLKSVTEYEGGLKATDPHVKWFWEVLEEMGPEDRTAFLKFAWARSRMPSKAELSTAFRLQQPSGGASQKPDDFLPSAQTCFFILALPRYTSKEILKTKFLKAIECTLMDADVRLRSAEGWAEV